MLMGEPSHAENVSMLPGPPQFVLHEQHDAPSYQPRRKLGATTAASATAASAGTLTSFPASVRPCASARESTTRASCAPESRKAFASTPASWCAASTCVA